MMAIVLTVLGMLLFLGSQGLPDSGFRAFTSHPMFRPANVGGSRLLPAGASPRLDAAALDALVGMEGMAPPTRYEDPPDAPSGGGWRTPRWLSQRPW